MGALVEDKSAWKYVLCMSDGLLYMLLLSIVCDVFLSLTQTHASVPAWGMKQLQQVHLFKHSYITGRLHTSSKKKNIVLVLHNIWRLQLLYK